jgi:aryl-alcohol dehydrogenase-like predicted oxidoreductase
MHTRTLGDGLSVSAIGIGCMPMIRGGNITYGADADPEEAIKTIHQAIDMGVTFFDTAQIYGPFQNEELVGEAIKGKRDGLIIATKFGFRFDGMKITGVDGSAANARASVEGSLKRLGIDCIDLYYQHRMDPNTPIEETMGALSDLVREGKIKHIGLSEAAPERLRAANAVHQVAALQSEYSLWERDVEDGILPTCRELGIGFVPYSPLGRGFLAGQISSFDELPLDDWRRNDPRWSPENFALNFAVVEAVEAIAARHEGASAAQVALAWLLAQGDDIVPIPGTKRRATMEDSVRAADLVLTAEDLAALDAASPKGATAGPRYGEQGMRMVRI